MLISARSIQREIEESGALKNLMEHKRGAPLSTDKVSPTYLDSCCDQISYVREVNHSKIVYVLHNSLQNNVNSTSNRHYPKLTIVGHSLGAGTAVLLTMCLRRDYPEATCVCYGTPAMLDQRAADECSPYVTSVVMGDDVVSRVSFASLVSLREHVRSHSICIV